ncbi:MAG: MFS transporter, partial [SAR324 cluster bacterium]|nr:MFS transporter [SAR324 cluster bacterium]
MRRPLAVLDGFRLLSESRPFLVLFVVCFVVAAMRPFFYNLGFLFFSDPHGIGLTSSLSTAVMSLGQVVEIGAMLVLAASLRVLGSRWTILLGAAALGLRFGVFSFGEPVWFVIAAQSLHGIGFTFFSLGCVVAVEALAPPQRRASAQSLLVFVNSGLGALAGHWLTGTVVDERDEPLADISVSSYMSMNQEESFAVPGQSRKIKTGADGRFDLRNLPSPKVRLGLYGKNVTRTRTKDFSVDQDVRIVMKDQGVILGRVIDKDTGEPISEFLVRAESSAYVSRLGD